MPIVAAARSSVNGRRRGSADRRTGAEIGLAGHLAAFFDRLPYTVTVAPRHRFVEQQYVDRDRVLDFDEINPDPAGWVTSIRVDVDHDGAGTSWIDGGLPQPTFTIRNRANGRAHLTWSLRRWIRRDNARAMRLLERVQRGFRDAVGGDRSYAGTFHHNPASPTYSTIVGPRDDFSLGELASCVGHEIFEPEPRSWSQAKIREDVELLGRNCALFENLRIAAYRDVARFREIGDVNAWNRHVHELAVAANETYTEPLPSSEIRPLVRSIAGWTWHVYGRGAAAAKERKRRHIQSREEYLAGVEARRARARELHDQGLTYQRIAVLIGVSDRTVASYVAGAANVSGDRKSPRAIRVCAPVVDLGTRAPAGSETVQKAPACSGKSAVRVATNDSNRVIAVVIPFRPRQAAAPAREPAPMTPSPPTNSKRFWSRRSWIHSDKRDASRMFWAMEADDAVLGTEPRCSMREAVEAGLVAMRAAGLELSDLAKQLAEKVAAGEITTAQMRSQLLAHHRRAPE